MVSLNLAISSDAIRLHSEKFVTPKAIVFLKGCFGDFNPPDFQVQTDK